MSQIAEEFASDREVCHDVQQSVTSDETVVITEQEVMLGTHVALSRRLPRRLVHKIWDAVGSLHLSPPKQHYPADSGYLEQSRMAREMYRL